MKNYICFIALIVLVSGCNYYDVEPRFDDRDRYVGYYDVEEYSETYDDITLYTLRISKSRHSQEIYLHNFYGADISVYATVHYDDVRIPFQVVDGFEIEGTGSFFRDELTLNYRVKDRYENTIANYCETTAWRD